jgi:hypothetical protein
MGCQKHFDPWGVWNKFPVSESDTIREFSTGKYYEVTMSGLYIVKKCREAIAGNFKFPAIVIPGEFTKIEKMEKIANGYIFYLVGDGFKHVPDGTLFQENTRIQLKMQFKNEDECFFEYINREDFNGFHLSYFPEENMIYRRLRVKR